ncbi:MAG TPA: hypothetical protein VKR31_17965 [Rhizomicrobium sp.]|nr:hypothetical protein [Rhizomicrobium sp.]
MTPDPGSIAVLLGLDGSALAPARLHDSDVMVRLRASLTGAPDLVRNFATESLSDALRSVLNVPLIDVLAAAWKTRHDLRQYCDQTKYPPGEVSNYVLAGHVISSTHRPRFQVLFDGAPCGPDIEFDVDLSLTVEAACLEIVNARITKATTGTIQGSGQIRCAGATLVERQTKKVDIPGKFSFGEGIPLGMPYRSASPAPEPAA